MIGSSPAMVEIYKTVCAVAPTDATVMIEGETGTGKELVARMIHRLQPARETAVRAGGLRVRLRPRCWRANLFGAMRGAFTGADRDRVGRVRGGEPGHGVPGRNRRDREEFSGEPAAVSAGARDSSGGRVAREGSGCAGDRGHQSRLAEAWWMRANSARICGTGLNTVRIVMPPLRERRDDIPLLARFYVNKYNGRTGAT